MGKRGEQTIQRRLSWAITTAVLLGLLIVGSIMVPVTSSRRMAALQTELEATARILAHNLTASVEFDDSRDARQILNSLRARASLSRAWILSDANIFQYYDRYEREPVLPPSQTGEVDGHLYFGTDIVRRGGAMNRLVLEDDLSGYRAGFWLDVAILAGAIVIAFAVLILLIRRLAKRISGPLSELAQHARRISQKEDYSLRLETSQGGEIAALFGAFGQMLERIRARDHQLLEAQARAEARAEEAERAREDLAITLHSIGDAFLACDAQGRVARMNPVAEQLTGWSSGEAIGQAIETVYRLVEPETGSPLPPPTRAVLQGGELAGNGHAQLVSLAGTKTPVADHAAPILDGGGRVVGAVLVARDVREQIELEERLRQGQKMEAIGQLAGGVAHDFNNLLTGILGFNEMLAAELGSRELPNDAWASHVRGIREAAERAADLTGQLLAFSRRGRLKREPVDVHAVLRATVGILQHTIGPKIKLELELGASEAVVFGDASQLHSAFLNLGVNARDAMPAGGTMTLATRNIFLDDLESQTLPFQPAPGPYLQICVADTGVGIQRHLLDKVFEPFFTTKKVGEGTGLGLAAVYGTMESHCGSIRVESEPYRGSTFICLLPEAPARIVAGDADDAPVLPDATERRLVLVADDEPMLRKVAKGLLERMGCEVLLAKDGLEAVQVYQARHRELALVLMDIQMPELDGYDAYAQMRRVAVDVPILLTTGSSIEPGSFPGARAENFVQKPYTLASLSAAVEALLQSRSHLPS